MSDKESVARLNLFDLLLLFVKWRLLFAVNFFLAVIVAVIVALTLPVWYSSSATLLPPSGGGGGLPSFLPSDLKGVAANFGLDVPTDEIYQTILSSRSLKEAICLRFNLKEVYEMSDELFLEDVIEAFKGHFTIVTRKDNSIVITVEDRDPDRAAEMANACIEELDRLYRNITSESARKNRIYIGKRLDRINDSLAVLQDSIVAFQRFTNAISIPDQTMAMINAASDIKAQQIAIDVRLDVMRNNLGPNHPLVSQLRSTSDELGSQYEQMINGSEGGLFISLQELPSLGRQYADFLRKMRIQSSLLEFVYPQYESAKIKEERETANVQILDRGVVPNYKSRPPRKLIVLITGAVSIIITLVIVLVLEYMRSLSERNQEDWRKVQEITRTFWVRRKKR